MSWFIASERTLPVGFMGWRASTHDPGKKNPTVHLWLKNKTLPNSHNIYCYTSDSQLLLDSHVFYFTHTVGVRETTSQSTVWLVHLAQLATRTTRLRHLTLKRQSVEAEGQRENSATAGDPTLPSVHRGHRVTEFRGSSRTTMKGTEALMDAVVFPRVDPVEEPVGVENVYYISVYVKRSSTAGVGRNEVQILIYISRFSGICSFIVYLFFWWLLLLIHSFVHKYLHFSLHLT